jgi:hypothetical protein
MAEGGGKMEGGQGERGRIRSKGFKGSVRQMVRVCVCVCAQSRFMSNLFISSSSSSSSLQVIDEEPDQEAVKQLFKELTQAGLLPILVSLLTHKLEEVCDRKSAASHKRPGPVWASEAGRGVWLGGG